MCVKWFLFYSISRLSLPGSKKKKIDSNCQVLNNGLICFDFEQFHHCSRTERWMERKQMKFVKRNTVKKYNFVLRCWLLIGMLLFVLLGLFICALASFASLNSFIRLFLILLLSFFCCFFHNCVNIKRIKREFFPSFHSTFGWVFYFALGEKNKKWERKSKRVGQKDRRAMVSISPAALEPPHRNMWSKRRMETVLWCTRIILPLNPMLLL